MDTLKYRKALSSENLHTIETAYNMKIHGIEQLFSGADPNTFIYKVQSKKPYFMKIRTGDFIESSIQIPYFLSQITGKHIIEPIKTADDGLFCKVADYTVILYPFISGKSGIELSLTKTQWSEFGKALRKIHDCELPPPLMAKISHESFDSQWSAKIKNYMKELAAKVSRNEWEIQFISLYNRKSDTINKIIHRTEKSAKMEKTDRHYCLCHGDIHAGNILKTCKDDFFIVDWDTLILAPKERDLMFIGGGVANKWNTVKEETNFYKGYGKAETVDQSLISYYRYIRILEDLVVYYDQFFADDIDEKKQRAIFQRVASAFDPKGVVDMAFRGDPEGKV